MADLELNSIGNGDGNNYLLRDNSKIPLSGSNQISGSLIPSTNETVNLGSSTNNYNTVYTRNIFHGLSSGSLILSGGNWASNGSNLVLYGKDRTDGFQGNFLLTVNDGANSYVLKGHQSGVLYWSGNVIRPNTDNTCDLGSSTYNFKNVYAYKLILKNSYIARTVNNDYLGLCGGTDYSNGAYFTLYGKDSTFNAGAFRLRANDGTNSKNLIGTPSGTLSWSGTRISASSDSSELNVDGGTSYTHGATLYLAGKDSSNHGCFFIVAHNGTNEKLLKGFPDGTLTWNGQSIQTTSDQRLKQQISQIDDDLLTAWEDVKPVQFKYNDAVETKSDNARLHTGYVVQQINEACQKHDVDISEYGLYCHEEYPERTEEVTIENEDGTTSKETKVIEPAREYYSLRYTETLVVECAYLRRENAKLKEQLQRHEDYLKLVEEHLHLKNL